VTANPRNVPARANLAGILVAAGEPDAAIREMDAIANAQPSGLLDLAPLIVALAANPDASLRRPQQALRLAEQLVAVAGRTAATVLDTLAIALAATGDFDAAMAMARAALDRLPVDVAERRAIQDRLALYRERRPFVLAKPQARGAPLRQDGGRGIASRSFRSYTTKYWFATTAR